MKLKRDIAELQEAEANGRTGTKASIDRQSSIQEKTDRIETLSEIAKFTYNPDGENRGRDSLNHSEVIEIGAVLLAEKETMQALLINRFPILLIDESQDTNKILVESLFVVQAKHKLKFVLGLFGDTMQRIYAEGKANLGKNIPEDWALPAKMMNHRSAKRIVTLINKIRSAVDDQQQTPRSDRGDGFVRLFILQNNTTTKMEKEKFAGERMAMITGDTLWTGEDVKVKTLILEHHMAARRMGFLDMYEPLYKNENLKIGLLDGSLPGLKLFGELVLPVVKAKEDPFAVASVLRKHSPLLSKERLQAAGPNQIEQIRATRLAVSRLRDLFSDGKVPRFLDVLLCLYSNDLFALPNNLRIIAERTQQVPKPEEQEIEAQGDDGGADGDSSAFDAWDKFLAAPFHQIEQYMKYMDDEADFDTHQGVKGLEFPRVMVIIDDTEARGFSFSYEKLFGAREKTRTDLENEKEGKETGIDRTRRLFYVTCSRAEKSLAIVAYSENPQKIKQFAVTQGWFSNDEVEIL